MPLSTFTIRAMLLPDSPPGRPQPRYRSSTVFGSRPSTLSSAALMISALRSSGRKSFSEPLLARPMGVRAALTMTASGMGTPFAGGLLRSPTLDRVLVLRARRTSPSVGAGQGGAEQLQRPGQEHPSLVRRLQERGDQDPVVRRHQRLGAVVAVLLAERAHDRVDQLDQPGAVHRE